MDGEDIVIIAAMGIGAYYLLRPQQAQASVLPDMSYLDTADDPASFWAMNDTGVADDGSEWAQDDTASPMVDGMGNFINTGFFGDIMSGWSESLIPAQYLQPIRDAEARFQLPRNLLARLLYQESHFRPDIISGQTRSAAGALGIAQFMPEKYSGVSAAVALDPYQAIPTAAQFLARLYTRFRAWPLALAAYNWGEGNVNSFVNKGTGAKGQAMPTETRNYFSQILADVGLLGVTT